MISNDLHVSSNSSNILTEVINKMTQYKHYIFLSNFLTLKILNLNPILSSFFAYVYLFHVYTEKKIPLPHFCPPTPIIYRVIYMYIGYIQQIIQWNNTITQVGIYTQFHTIIYNLHKNLCILQNRVRVLQKQISEVLNQE